jgi:hypothetical protein
MKTVTFKLSAAAIIISASLIGLLAASETLEADNDINRDSIEASSTLKDNYNRFDVTHLFDGLWPAWCEGRSDDGIGEKFVLSYSSYRKVKISKLYMKNGFGLRQYFQVNNRVKILTLSNEIGESRTLQVKDTAELQKIDVKPHLEGTRFTFIISAVYPGTKYKDTCISEISFNPLKIQDKTALPEFKKISFMLTENSYSGGSRIELNNDGSVEGDHSLGHQCDNMIVSGQWKKNPKGEVQINYVWRDPVNCGDMEAEEMISEKRNASLTLKVFGLDAIVDSQGRRGRDILITEK